MRRPIDVLLLSAIGLLLAACGGRDVRIVPAKPPPGAEANGDRATLPRGRAVVIEVDTGGDDRVEMIGNDHVRVWPTTRERTFVLVGQTLGEGPVQVKVEGDLEKTISVTVTSP